MKNTVTDVPQTIRQTIKVPRKRLGRASKRRSTVSAMILDKERPKPSTVALVMEALDHCALDPRTTPRSNQARLLFAVYYCGGLPFPRGWREACVEVLEENDVSATAAQLDLLYTAMNSDAAEEFDGWPGIDPVLVRDLLDRH